MNPSSNGMGLELTQYRTAFSRCIHGLMEVFGLSILFWDHLITFDSELQHIWTHFKARSSLLFIAFRYFTLLSSVSKIALTDFDSWTIDLSPFVPFIAVLKDSHIAATSTVSADKLSFSFHKRVKHSDFMPSTRVTNEFYFFLYNCLNGMRVDWRQELIHYPIEYGCYTGTSRKTSVRIAGIWMVLFAYDAIVFLMTAYRTYRYWRMEQMERENLLSLMFRDGALYFGVMALANMANILTFLRAAMW
ncbi:hypothetical protein MPER_09939, partial [Moniliophthora perniciosa FA553]